MFDGRSDKVIQYIETINRSPEMKVGILGHNGSPAFGTHFTLPAATFSSSHPEPVITGKEIIFYAPLTNEQRCHGCHNPKDSTRGMVVIKHSLEIMEGQIAGTATRIIFFALLIGFISEAFLVLIMRRTILNPLETLTKGASILKAGILDHRIRIKSGDELETLASAFNQMAASLEKSHEHLERAVKQKTNELRVVAELSTEVFKGDLAIRDIIERFMDAITNRMGFGYAGLCLVDNETGLLSNEFRKGIEDAFCTMEIALASEHPFVKAIREARPSIKGYEEIGAPEAFGNVAIIPVLSHQRKRCRDINLCQYDNCPAFSCEDERCWLVGDTLCRSPQSVAGKEKIYGCLHCPAFPVIGVLIAGKGAEIAESSLHSLEILSSEIASAIENNRFIEGKKEDISSLVALHDISVEKSSTLSMPDLTRSIVTSSTAFAGMNTAVLWLKKGEELHLESSFSADSASADVLADVLGKRLVPGSLSLNGSFPGRSITEGRVIETVRTEEVTCLSGLINHYDFRYAAAVPLKFKGTVYGCLTLFKKKDFFMTDSEKAVILLFAGQAAAAMHTAKLYQALSESEEKYRAVMNDASDAIILLDSQGNLLETNKKLENLSGYTKEELLRMHFTRLLSPQEIQRASEAFNDTILHGLGQITDLEAVKKDGSHLPVDITASIIEFADTRLVQAIIRDISDRKKTEDVLYTIIEKISGMTGGAFFTSMVQYLARILQMDYTFVAELTEDGGVIQTIAVCAHGSITDNFSYALPGTPCETVVGKGLCTYPSGVRQLFPEDRMLVDMGVDSYIGIPLFHTWGKPLGIIAALDSKPITDLKFAEFACQIFSVRASAEIEHMHADKALQAEKKFSEAIFNYAASGIMVLDKTGRVLKINRTGGDILRVDMEEITGRKITDVYPETKEMLHSHSGLGREIAIALPNGTSIPVGFTGSPLQDSPDYAEGTIILFRDLSEIKRLQAEVRKREHFETMGQVISGVAHEVRNPLFGISSIGQILERELESPQHQALIQAMLKETNRMKRLIEELLLYTRPSRLDLKDVDMGILMEELRHFANAKRPDVLFSVNTPPLLMLRADRDKITQVFLNLINNAIEVAKSSITVSAVASGGMTKIVVADDGTGILEQDMDRIFEPFFTTKKGGTGLGLPICKKIIEDHGGAIEVRSSKGKGTIVTLSFRQ